MHLLSLATPTTLPQARVLARSLRAHEPDWPMTVGLITGAARPLPREEGFAVVDVHKIPDVDLPALAGRYEARDLRALLAPRLLLWSARRRREPMLYLDPTAWICGSLEPVAAAVRQDGIVLVARAHALPEDGAEPTRERLVEEGRVASSFIAVDGSDRALAFLEWWAARIAGTLSRFGASGHGSAASDDRSWAHRYLELATALFGGGALEAPGCNLSYWNLHEHGLGESERGPLTDGEAPLRFVDLPGFEPDRPYRLSAEATRVRVSHSPALRSLTSAYARELLSAGWTDLERAREVGRTLANGLVFDDRLRRMHAEALAYGEDFGDIFTAAGTETFMAWMRGPAQHGAHAGITRFLYRVYRDRPDIPKAYPDLDGSDGLDFAAWCWVFGQREVDIPPEFLPTRPAHVEAAADTPPELEVRVSGYLGHTLGLGAAARAYVEALRAAEVSVATTTVGLTHLARSGGLTDGYGRESYADLAGIAEHGFDLVCVNPDELTQFMAGAQGLGLGERPCIGVWGWETDAIPRRWSEAFGLVDEIWVYSRFVAENLSRVAPVPVVPLPPPVALPSAADAPLRLGVPPGFLFLFVFDYLSTVQRKNPVGLIEAFKLAFSAGEGPRLLIKTLNGPLRTLAEEEVLWACAGRTDIHVVDCSLTTAERDALMATCDCYVSLHRAEGFGLTMAEAMALGKPVIATGYSGNTDFMNSSNSYLVDYAMARVGPDCEIYPPDGEWAQPNVEHAAELMRGVWQDRDQAGAVGARARSDIRRQLSPEATGHHMRARLERLARMPTPRARGQVNLEAARSNPSF